MGEQVGIFGEKSKLTVARQQLLAGCHCEEGEDNWC